MTPANNKWHVVFKRLSLPASREPCNCPCKVSPEDFVGCLDIIQQKAYCKNIWNRCVRNRETKEGLPGTSHGTSTSKSHTTTICCRDFYPQRILNPWTIYHHLHIWVKCNQCNNSPSFQSYERLPQKHSIDLLDDVSPFIRFELRIRNFELLCLINWDHFRGTPGHPGSSRKYWIYTTFKNWESFYL